MAQSINVNLPRSHPAVFPDRCVVCDRPSPDAQVRVMTGSVGWWTWLTWMFGKPFIVKAPSCRHCGWKLHGLRSLSLLVTIAIGSIAIFLVWPHLKGSIPPPLRRWAMMGLALSCLIPQIIVEVIFAKPFDITAYSNNVDYEFTSLDYATEFAGLNHHAESIKVDGIQIARE